MIFKAVGKILKKDTKTKAWWLKLAVSLVLSNIFFFILFSNDSEVSDASSEVPEGQVEVRVNAELMTPFHYRKKVLLVHRSGRKKIEGMLINESTEHNGRLTVLVHETEAHSLLQLENWEILPVLKHFNFASVKKEESHEIRY